MFCAGVFLFSFVTPRRSIQRRIAFASKKIRHIFFLLFKFFSQQ